MKQVSRETGLEMVRAVLPGATELGLDEIYEAAYESQVPVLAKRMIPSEATRRLAGPHPNPLHEEITEIRADILELSDEEYADLILCEAPELRGEILLSKWPEHNFVMDIAELREFARDSREPLFHDQVILLAPISRAIVLFFEECEFVQISRIRA